MGFTGMGGLCGILLFYLHFKSFLKGVWCCSITRTIEQGVSRQSPLFLSPSTFPQNVNIIKKNLTQVKEFWTCNDETVTQNQTQRILYFLKYSPILCWTTSLQSGFWTHKKRILCNVPAMMLKMLFEVPQPRQETLAYYELQYFYSRY